jgi:hypothetical protein
VTDHDLNFLKSQIDQVVLIETSAGERIFAQILFVFDGEDTPDVFFLEVERGSDGAYIQKGRAGYSVLLSEIAAVHPAPEDLTAAAKLG